MWSQQELRCTISRQSTPVCVALYGTTWLWQKLGDGSNHTICHIYFPTVQTRAALTSPYICEYCMWQQANCLWGSLCVCMLHSLSDTEVGRQISGPAEIEIHWARACTMGKPTHQNKQPAKMSTPLLFLFSFPTSAMLQHCVCMCVYSWEVMNNREVLVLPHSPS